MVDHRKYPLFYLGALPSGQGYANVAQYPLHHVTYSPAKFQVATSNSLGDAFTKNTLSFLIITQNVAQYRPHKMTYAPSKFEVVKCNGLGGDTFSRKYII